MRLLMRLARATTSITVALLAAAEVGAQSVVRHGPLLEAHIWGGYTTFAGADGLGATSRSVEGGLRSLELAIRPTHSLRVFGRYDNTLSLDNLALIRAGRRIPLYRAGAQVDWAGRFTTITHVSHRTLPGRIQQTMLGGEQVVFLPGGIAAKAGGWVGPRSDNLTEWLAHAGVNFAAGRSVRLEPTLFYTRSGLANEHQWRALLVGETRLGSRLTLGGGAARGQNTSIDTRLSGTASTEFVRLSASVAHAQTLHLLINHESAPGTQRLTTIAAGMSIGVPRR